MPAWHRPVVTTRRRLVPRDLLPHDADVSGIFARDALDAGITEARQIEPGKQILSLTDEHGRDRQTKFIDPAGLQILPDNGGTAADPDIL